MSELTDLSRFYEDCFNCPPLIRLRGKVPIDKDWTAGPFEHPEEWRSRLDGWTGNVGMVTGRGLLVLDADLYKSEAQGSFDALVDDCGLDRDTVRQLSGGGGTHQFYDYDNGLHVPSGHIDGYPGLDVKADGGMIVVAPSVHPETANLYAFEEGHGAGEIPMTGAPAKLLELLCVGGSTASDAERPGDELFEPMIGDAGKAGWAAKSRPSWSARHGWTWQITRPGKHAREGTSASVHPWPTPHVVVFSTTALGQSDRLGFDPQEWASHLGVEMGPCPAPQAPVIRTAAEVSLAECHATFRRWFGESYDLDTVDAVLAAAAVERLVGDPLWLLVISGPGNAKTETVQALSGAGAVVSSTITSVGALLSAAPRKDRAADATGGLLRRLGDRGVLVIKDMTSILSMDRNTRAGVVGALREVYDGYWERNVGTDGGRSIKWQGRIVLVGAVTTAWDRFGDVVSMMGDRFVLLRPDSTVGRFDAGRRSIANTGDEEQMRQELAAAVGGVMAGASLPEGWALTDAERDRLLAAADLVTLARTAVDFDYRGDVVDSHAPEMPTRFVKELQQVVRGAVSLGMDRDGAMRLALRCARDSMPPLRLAILDDLAEFPHSTTTQVRRRLGKPRNTVDRQLQALQMLGVVECEEVEYDQRPGGTRWFYSLATEINPETLVYAPLPRVQISE
jgi:hypothetical protein